MEARSRKGPRLPAQVLYTQAAYKYSIGFKRRGVRRLGIRRAFSLWRGLGAGGGEEECFTVERQLRLAREAAATLRGCAQALGDGFSPDVVAPDMLRACELLDNVTGRDASEEVISAIFANFCVGK